jgi:hypothetical protein
MTAQNIKRIVKPILIYEDDWKKVTTIKVNKGYKNAAEVIAELLKGVA